MERIKYKPLPNFPVGELAPIRELAQMIRESTDKPRALELRTNRLLAKREGKPAPLIELFDWAQTAATKDRSLETFRDVLYELITLCFRVERYYACLADYPDLAPEPFDAFAVADRLCFLTDQLSNSGHHFARAG